MTPFEIYKDEERKQRATGRTTRLIMSLPSMGKYVVIVYTNNNKRHLKNMIRDLRGEDVAKNAMIVSVEDARQKLAGNRLPVYVEHTVFYEMGLNYLKTYNIDV